MATNQRPDRARRRADATSPRTPTRTCIGCRTARPCTEMVRCAIDRSGTPRLGRTAPGRGAWLCSAECAERAIARRGLDRAWRRPAPQAAVELLRIAFESTNENMRHLSAVGNVPLASAPTKG